MTTLSFHGASGTVTGSCYLLQDESSKVLIDCGFFQGSEELEKQNAEAFGFEPSLLDGVLLTHAHLDHCGRLPKLVKEGFSGPIYMTSATRDLLEITLTDSAKVMHENDGNNAIYTEEEVLRVMELSKIIDYDTEFEYCGYKIRYVNAGHILGSASILLEKNGQKIAMSGDLGNSPQDIIQPTEYLHNADIAVMESTYGDTNHPHEDPTEVLKVEIQRVEKNGGTLLIPAFSLERTQEILHKIDHLKRSGAVKNETLVFLDSPMAIRATEVFRRFTDLYNKEMVEHLKRDDPFAFPGLQVIYRGKDSNSLKDIPDAKVIIAGSGMMNGGRILNHAQFFLPLPTTTLLFVGYQGENTIGRKIMEGAKNVDIYSVNIPINARLASTQAMSSHADQTGLLKWFSALHGVKKLFLTHGEEEPRTTLAGLIQEKQPSLEIIKPHKGDEATI